MIHKVCVDVLRKIRRRQVLDPRGASGKAYVRVLAEQSAAGEITVARVLEITHKEIRNEARDEHRRRLLQGD